MGAIYTPKKAIEIINTAAGNIAATDVQGAINELDTEKEAAFTTLSIAKGGTGNTQGSGVLNTNCFVIGATDFTISGTQGGFPTWAGAGFGTTAGANSGPAGNANHPGIVRLLSAIAADSGYRFTFSTSALLLAGGETSEFIFRPQTIAGTTLRMGFHDTITAAAPVDGAWLDIVDDVLSGKTRDNSTESVTSTTYTLITDTWYRAKAVVNSNASRVDFYLYSEAGDLLWTDFLTTNIPAGIGRGTGHGVVASNSGISAVTLVDLDYMNLYIDRVLVR